MDSLYYELPIGLSSNGEMLKNVELLRTNGVAEKVFVTKIAEKPYTWQGNVLSVAIKSIGNVEIGAGVREKYLKEGSVTIPEAILHLTLADVNTSLVEIHRRCWVSQIPKQEVVCKFCGRRLEADIDLDKIDYLPETKQQMQETLDYSQRAVDLKYGFQPPALGKITEQEKYAGITDTVYNRFVFRPPLLKDAIRNEAYFTDSITFWRRIALDCLVGIQLVENGEVIDVLPDEFKTYYGLKIFNEYLTGSDLKAVRDILTEHLPTLPFAYYEPCGCNEQRMIPVIMEASNFFSE